MSRFDFLRTRLGFAKFPLEAIASLETRIAERWVSAAYHIYPLLEFYERKIGMFRGWGRPGRPIGSSWPHAESN